MGRPGGLLCAREFRVTDEQSPLLCYDASQMTTSMSRLQFIFYCAGVQEATKFHACVS